MQQDQPDKGSAEWKFHIKPIHQKLRARAKELHTDTRPVERLSYLRLYAEELAGQGGFRDDFLMALLDEASPVGQPIQGGIELPADLFDRAVPFVWGDLLMAHNWTLFSAKPKAGKSAIAAGLISALLNGEQSYLDQKLDHVPDFVLIIGNDMAEEDWYRYFLNTGCLKRFDNGSYVLSDRIMIYCRESSLQLNDSGIETIKGLCKPHKHSLILIDTYRSSVRSLRLKESDAGFCKPIEDLMQALASANLQVTGLVNHHSPKASYDAAIEDAASGSNALSGAFDGLLNLRSAFPKAKKSHKKAIFYLESKNRGDSENNLLIKRGDSNLWKYLQAGAEFAELQSCFVEMEKLTPQQAKVLDALTVAADNNREIDTVQLAQQLNIEVKATQRLLRQLDMRGMAERTSVQKPSPLGGSIAAKWRAAEWVKNYTDERIDLEIDSGGRGAENTTPQDVRARGQKPTSPAPLPVNLPDPAPEAESQPKPPEPRTPPMSPQPPEPRASVQPTSTGIDKAPPVGTDVEVHCGDSWKAARVTELHDSLSCKVLLITDGLQKTVSNCRMGIDLRLPESPSKPPSCGF